MTLSYDTFYFRLTIEKEHRGSSLIRADLFTRINSKEIKVGEVILIICPNLSENPILQASSSYCAMCAESNQFSFKTREFVLIDSVLIFDEFQNQGIGRRALKNLIKLFLAPNTTFCLLLEERNLALKNPLSQQGEAGYERARTLAFLRLKRFYERLGFSLLRGKVMILDSTLAQGQLRLNA